MAQPPPYTQALEFPPGSIVYDADGNPVYVKYKAKYKIEYIALWLFLGGIPGWAGYCTYKFVHGRRKDARLRKEFYAQNKPELAKDIEPVVVMVSSNPQSDQELNDGFIFVDRTYPEKS